MIRSDSDPKLFVNAWGGAAFGAQLLLHDACTADNKDCQWILSKGMLLSARSSNLRANAFGGRAFGTPIKLHNQCVATNPDCNFNIRTAGPQCGRYWQAPCAGNTCTEGVKVGNQCRPQESRVNKCTGLEAGDVTAHMDLGLNNTGNWSFRGHAHDSGAFGLNYTVAVSSSYKDASGKNFGTTHSGVVHGTFDIGSRDDDFVDKGKDQKIVDNWDGLVAGTWNCKLKTTANPWLIGENALIGLGIAAFGGIFVFTAANADDCSWQIVSDSSGGAGVEYRCRDEF